MNNNSWASPEAWRAGFLSRLSRDGWLLFVTCALRSFAYGFLSVMLGLFLAAIGLDAVAIGIVFTAALAGGAAMTVLLTTVADQYGRRRVLMVGAALMALAGTVFALTNNLILLAIAAVLGTISPSGKEVGPFLSIEQAMLPQTTGSERRTNIFAAYNLVGSLAGALGALAVGLPSVLGIAPLAGYRLLIWGYVFAALAMLVLFARLSPALEAAVVKSAPSRRRYGLHRSRGAVARTGAAAIAPAFTGWMLAMPALGLPFLFAGGLKIIYDISIFALFRHVRPPEEESPARGTVS